MESRSSGRQRAAHFSVTGLEVRGTEVTAHFASDDERFEETVRFSDEVNLTVPGVAELARLWAAVAALSYYKTGAAHAVDLSLLELGAHGRDFVRAAWLDGLGEFSFENDLDLTGVAFDFGPTREATPVAVAGQGLLTPFGGGIDSVVTVELLRGHVDQRLFIVSPESGPFAPLEATAAVTGLASVRATRRLDPQLRSRAAQYFHGHVPVTAMVTLLAAMASLGVGRRGVAMSNEHSASVPNVHWRGRDINHQWSKSWTAEVLLGAAVAELVEPSFVVASVLRDRSELWVADVFSRHPQYHGVFRSCNRAFTQDVAERAAHWCGVCDKCLFINLVLAPFVSRAHLADVFASEPLADPQRAEQLATLVGLHPNNKPFECVGDPDECAGALRALAERDEWCDVAMIQELAAQLDKAPSLADLLEPQGASRVPAHWLS